VTLEDGGINQGVLSERPAPDGSDIRKLTAADVPVIASALARAFEDDPVMNYVLQGDEDMIGRLERAFTFFLRNIWLPQDECFATTRLSGAALWLPPGKWHLSPWAQLRLLPGMVWVLGSNLPRMMSVLNLIEKKHPKEPPHHYLAVLGVEPELQGRGFGGALMQPVLSVCDRDRAGAYLESSKERNVVLYERHGFRVIEQVHLPKGGPPIWRMWRDAAS
jgi:ribosomal protein S18 acetylase RimI-like enzyme